MGHRNDAFALGERGALLHHLDQPAVIPHVAQSEGRRLPLEVGLGLEFRYLGFGDRGLVP